MSHTAGSQEVTRQRHKERQWHLHLSCLHLKRSLLRLWDRGLECTEKRSRGAGGEGGRGSCSGRMTSKPCHVKPLTVPSGHQTKTETEVDGTELKAARWHLQLSCLHSNRGQEIAVLTAQRKRVMEVDGERTAVSHCGGRAAGSVYSSSNNSSFCETQRISSRNVYSLACVFVTGRLVSTLAQHTDPKERFVVSGLVIIIIQWPSNLQRRQSDSCKRMCCCCCCWCLGVVYQRFRENQWIGAVLCGRERPTSKPVFLLSPPPEYVCHSEVKCTHTNVSPSHRLSLLPSLNLCSKRTLSYKYHSIRTQHTFCPVPECLFRNDVQFYSLEVL